MAKAPALPLDVHQVLEEEYVSMYGPLPPSPDGSSRTDEYTAADVRDADVDYMRGALQRLGVYVAPQAGETAKDAVVDALNALRADTSSKTGPAARFDGCGDLSGGTVRLIRDYDEYDVTQKQSINRRILDEIFVGGVRTLRDARLRNVYDAVHARANAGPGGFRTALCISGGGIRSATFALGVMQGLAGLGLLKHVDYLSTVSGGGYIGSWLSSWVRRHPEGIEGVERDLGVTPSATPVKLEPEPKPVRHLRDYSNYLSPRLGILSADAWTMAALYVRNLLLNWLVLVPIFAAALAIPRVMAWLNNNVQSVDVLTVAYVAFGALAAGFTYLGFSRPIQHGAAAEPRLKWIRRLSADTRFICFCVVPLTIGAAAMSLFWAIAQRHPLSTDWGTLAIGGFLVMTGVPGVIYFVRFIQTPFSVRRESAVDAGQAVRRMVYETIATVASGVVGVALFYLFATQVFDYPTAALPNLGAMLPFDRPLLWLEAEAELYVCLAVPLILVTFFIQAGIFVGVAGRKNQDYDREWWARAGAWLLIVAGGWAVISLISVFGPLVVYQAPGWVASIGGLSGLLAVVLGRSKKTPANPKQKEEAGKTAAISNAALGLAVPVFVVFLLAVLSAGTTFLIRKIHGPEFDSARWEREAMFSSVAQDKNLQQQNPHRYDVTAKSEAMPLNSVAAMRSLDHLAAVHDTRPRDVALFGTFLGVGLLFSLFIDVNKFSMHALYRNRLIRAYLGASRYVRDPDRFTGFDPNDNVQMHHLRPELLWGTSFCDAQKFVDELVDSTGPEKGVQTDREKMSGYLWNQLDWRTRRMLRRGQVSGDVIDALVQRLNVVIDTEENLIPKRDLDATSADSRPLATRNREHLDALYPDCIRKMPPVRRAPYPAPASVPEQEAILVAEAALAKSSTGGRSRPPLHVVNMALNLVSGAKLAWQQRKAESFTCSPLHSGSPFLGYREARTYGGEQGVSLGTAVTISGAAASPNMGYHSSPALAFLLTFFNVRLGWWLGNPGPAGRNTAELANPRTTLGPFLRETIGKTDDLCPYVYLSDGGHFENLGLYEMVLRRCHYIVVSDAGCDPKYVFEDLGNAIRKIRTDLGVPIEMDDLNMTPRDKDGNLPETGSYRAVGTIQYKAVDGPNAVQGKLIYLKAGIYKTASLPKDIYNYAKEWQDFPHESTADQFFSESQFESYRALGRHVIEQVAMAPPLLATKPYLSVLSGEQ